jgi:NADH-quinone oxidoreductase subunit M
MPIFAALAMIFVLASIGLPGSNGFAGEFLILLGAFTDRPLYGVLGALGVVLGATYLLVMVRRVFFGPVAGRSLAVRDLGAREIAALVPLALLVVALGIWPSAFTRPLEPAVAGLLTEMSERTAVLDAHDGIQRMAADLPGGAAGVLGGEAR